MIHANFIWDKQINKQWVKLFDDISSNAALPEQSTAPDLALPVMKGEML
jgi:hypothetical protein